MRKAEVEVEVEAEVEVRKDRRGAERMKDGTNISGYHGS
jgi:hypothetical protein